jgi:hypothetical protein
MQKTGSAGCTLQDMQVRALRGDGSAPLATAGGSGTCVSGLLVQLHETTLGTGKVPGIGDLERYGWLDVNWCDATRCRLRGSVEIESVVWHFSPMAFHILLPIPSINSHFHLP